MFNNKKQYHFSGYLTVNRSKLLNVDANPQDDVTNWLFMVIGKKRFSFVYKITNPREAKYGYPFDIDINFTVYERIKEFIKFNKKYQIQRGEEYIGYIVIVKKVG